ncbi:3-isopropylmalate dehydratase small subunit [Psychrobacillus sp. OK032]|uniref:3-isopropylmalate dehydratase small subunit n=1 Tax=Psychrobacillus sp. OK032 TaxID=1884358 RepID=UPI0008CB3432|nr:3-isopropylmalate dehydratase small subunit [Psychrobacillus sp. OK032]SES00560.1 3-isopropylmalate/(R)-2-methylmalate dehydratase small subunit [Psychrobacillus sp. OK032]
MEPFKKLTSVVTPLNRPNIDTDAIIPTEFLKRIERTGFGQFLFYEWRFDEQEKQKPDFVLNKPVYEGSNILLTGSNFGCGSSREHAPWALSDYGFKVIIASAFADIFFNNCFKNGILPIKLPEDIVQQLFQKINEHESFQITVDLEKQTISDSQGFQVIFDVDPYRKECLLKGLDDIGITLEKEEKIKQYEGSYIVI